MEERNVVQLLQQYRHDVMNELQVVSGYLSMDYMEEVKDKIDQLILNYHEERKLFHTNAPHFIIWIMQFNKKEMNMRLSYELKDEKIDLSGVDHLLVNQLELIIQQIKKRIHQLELYQLHIQLEKLEDASCVRIILTVSGIADEVDNQDQDMFVVQGVNLVSIKRNHNNWVYSFDIQLNR